MRMCGTLEFICLFAVVWLLAGCAPGPAYWDVRKDAPIFDRIDRRQYPARDAMLLACLKYDGTFTTDHRACMIQGRGVCHFLTIGADRAHEQELTAICNGYVPPGYVRHESIF